MTAVMVDPLCLLSQRHLSTLLTPQLQRLHPQQGQTVVATSGIGRFIGLRSVARDPSMLDVILQHAGHVEAVVRAKCQHAVEE